MAAKKSDTPEERFVFVALSSTKNDLGPIGDRAEFEKWGYRGKEWRSGTKRYLPWSFVQRLMSRGYPLCEATPDMPDAKWTRPIPTVRPNASARQERRIELEAQYADEPKVIVIADSGAHGLGTWSENFFALGQPTDWKHHEAREIPVSLWQAIKGRSGLRLANEHDLGPERVESGMVTIIRPWREEEIRKTNARYLAWMGAPQTAAEKEAKRQERIAQIKKELPTYEAHPNTYSRKLQSELAELEGDE